MMAGAKLAQDQLSTPDLSTNIAYQYAVMRNILQQKGKLIEILVSYEPQWYTLMMVETTLWRV